MNKELKTKIFQIIKKPLFIPIAFITIPIIFLIILGLLHAWLLTLLVLSILLTFIGIIWIINYLGIN